MAKGKTTTITKVVNNMQATTLSNITVEMVVVNDQLVPDNRDINPGVFSR